MDAQSTCVLCSSRGSLSPPVLSHLQVISNCLHSPVRREKLAIALENEGYVKKLVSVFHTCEDLENMEGLHLLYEIFKNIFLLNKNALFEIMFADDTIFDVVGCLEYDPSSPYPRRHRQYLKSIAKFKEVSSLQIYLG